MFNKIPDIAEPKFFDKIIPSHSKFVSLTDGEIFDVKMQYPNLQMTNAVAECFVRQEVFEKLKIAQGLLPKGFKLRIWDAWRPFNLQEELYEKYSQNIIENLNLADANLETKQTTVAKYISLPVKDKTTPAVHTTGGAVDVTILSADGQELNMGTEFDAFGDKTKTNYYETSQESIEIRNNRRLLYYCMTSAGFTNLPSEWWHYDFGDKFWAYYNNTPALYTGVFCISELDF